MISSLAQPPAPKDLTRFDRIWLHLRCLVLDRKYRWHWAGICRELRPGRPHGLSRSVREGVIRNLISGRGIEDPILNKH